MFSAVHEVAVLAGTNDLSLLGMSRRSSVVLSDFPGKIPSAFRAVNHTHMFGSSSINFYIYTSL